MTIGTVQRLVLKCLYDDGSQLLVDLVEKVLQQHHNGVYGRYQIKKSIGSLVSRRMAWCNEKGRHQITASGIHGLTGKWPT